MPPSVEDTEECCVISIDFGTTYSGVAWCFSREPSNIRLVGRWTTRLDRNNDSAKAPTELYYDASREQPFWGYDVPLEEDPVRWFKLLLVGHNKLPPNLQKAPQILKARQSAKDLYKTEVEIVGDYLRMLWEHAISEIGRERGQPTVDITRFKVWITVPAIWDEEVQARMRQAAEFAGINARRAAGPTSIDLVVEPEAAALAVLYDFKGRPNVKVGDVFVVCDAGGGTVDLISYEIVAANPLMVKECVEGKGKMCGSIFIDEGFERVVQSTLGEKWNRMSVESRKVMLNNSWEHGIKRQYVDEAKTLKVIVPLEAFAGWRQTLKRRPFDDDGGAVPMKSGELRGHIRSIFSKVLGDIRGLLHEQVKAVRQKQGKRPIAIMLVGGLGSSNYLYQEIKKEFTPQNIEVLQPGGDRPWTAVCRGAVLRGLSAMEVKPTKHSAVLSRISRANYGVAYTIAYDEKLHGTNSFHPDDFLWCKRELKWKVENQMRWYLRKGDDISHGKPVRWRYYRLIKDAAEFCDAFHITVYRNTDDHAPTRLGDEVKQLTDALVKIDQPIEDFELYRNSKGTVFRKVNLEIEMVSKGLTTTWRLLIGGKVQGEKDIRIEVQ